MNTQKEFLQTLEEELKYLKAQETNEILKHYRDKINTELDYGTSEDKIIKNLPLPKDIAKEIYDSRGISNLEIQKKKYRQKEIGKAIISALIILLMTILLVVFGGYFGYVNLKLFSIFSGILTFRSIIDILLTSLVVITLILGLISAFVFLIDLFYIVITSFLTNILKANKKTYKPHYKFQEFTISGLLKEKAKGKNILLIIMLSFFGAAILFSGASVFSKGYIYRSLSNTPEQQNTSSYEATNIIKEIQVKGTNANIEVRIDDSVSNVSLEYVYEFSNNVNISETQNNQLKIENIGSKTFGLFGLLDEPTPLLIIKVPNKNYLKDISITLDDGKLYLNRVVGNDLSVIANIYDCELYVENSNFKTLTLNECYKTTLKIATLPNEEGLYENEYSWISNINIMANTGSVYLEGIRTNNFSFESVAASLVTNKCYLDSANIITSAGSMQMINVIGNEFNFKTSSSNNILTDITYQNATITANMASKIVITRIAITDTLNFNAYTNGTIHATYAKAKLLKVDNQNSNVAFEKLNKICNAFESDSDIVTILKNRYNNANIQTTKLEITSTGITAISDSTIHDVFVKQTGKTLQVIDTNIFGNAMFENTSVEYLKFSKVYGTDIHFVLKDSELNYYNDEEANPDKAKFYYRYIGASLAVSTDVAKELEEVGDSNE